MIRSLRLVFALALICLAAPAFASVVIAHTFEQLVERTPTVVHGRVGQVEMRFNDELGHIYTYAEIVVEATLKGRAPSILLVRQPGGIWGNRKETVAGTAQFTPGEQVIVLIEPAADEPGVWVSVALAAGKVAVEKNSAGKLVARRYMSGLAFMSPAGKNPRAKPLVEAAAVEELGLLDDVLARIRLAANRGER